MLSGAKSSTASSFSLRIASSRRSSRPAYSLRSKCRAILFLHDSNGRNLPPIVRFAAMGGAAVGEEPLLVRVGVDPQANGLDAGGCQTCGRQGRQVEEGMPRRLRRREEAGVGRIEGQEAIDEFRADLVALRADRGTETGD